MKKEKKPWLDYTTFAYLGQLIGVIAISVYTRVGISHVYDGKRNGFTITTDAFGDVMGTIFIVAHAVYLFASVMTYLLYLTHHRLEPDVAGTISAFKQLKKNFGLKHFAVVTLFLPVYIIMILVALFYVPIAKLFHFFCETLIFNPLRKALKK